MAQYPTPVKYNGQINLIFNPEDYSTYSTNTSLIQTLASVQSLASIQSIASAQYANNSQTATFTSTPSFDIGNGLLYNLASNSTVITTVSFTSIPQIIPLASYIFTFFLTPNTASSPYYLLPNSNFVSINGTSYPLYGLSNISLPSTYTTLVQQIILTNTSATFTPSFIALTSVSGY